MRCTFFPSLAALEQRLRQRNADNEASFHTRLAIAPTEMAHYRDYYVIVNDDRSQPRNSSRRLSLPIAVASRLNRRYPIFAEMDGWIHERGPST